MKKLLLLVLILFYSLPFMQHTAFAETPVTVKKIGIIELDNKTIYPQLGNLASAAITVHLIKNKSCDIIDPEIFSQAFKQREINFRGVLNPAIISSIGTPLGLDYVLMGSVVSASAYSVPGHWKRTKFGPQYVSGYSGSTAKFEVILLDTKTAKILWSDKYDGSATDTTSIAAAIEDGGYQTGRRIYKFMPLQGTIEKIEGEKYYINLTSVNGIEKGDRFSPIIPGELGPDVDKESRQHIILKVTEVTDMICVAELIRGKSTDLAIGTKVNKHFKTQTGFLGFRVVEKLDKSTK